MGQIAIVGAGLSGLVCADRLVRARHDVVVFDKSRGIGGRFATRRREGFMGNHGAPAAVASGPQFKAFLEQLVSSGSGAFIDLRASDLALHYGKSSEVGCVGLPGMSSLLQPLLDGLTLELNTTITAMDRDANSWWLTDDLGRSHGPYSCVVSAIPAAQAKALVDGVDSKLGDRLGRLAYAPVWTMLIGRADAWTGRRLLPDDHPIFGAIIPQELLPGHQGGQGDLVLHARLDWSEANLEASPEAVKLQFVTQVEAALEIDLSTASYVAVHRWRYAVPVRTLGQACLLTPSRLGLCGDWCMGSGSEDAFESGLALAREILQSID